MVYFCTALKIKLWPTKSDKKLQCSASEYSLVLGSLLLIHISLPQSLSMMIYMLVSLNLNYLMLKVIELSFLTLKKIYFI